MDLGTMNRMNIGMGEVTALLMGDAGVLAGRGIVSLRRDCFLVL